MDAQETAKEKLEKIANTTDLLTAIKRLEQRRELQEVELSALYHEALVNLKPKNILKNTLKEVSESTPLKQNLLKVALGLGAGYLSRKMIVKPSAGSMKKMLGAALQYGVTNFIASRDTTPDEKIPLKERVGNFFKKLIARKQPA